jgi:hypothetical protein
MFNLAIDSIRSGCADPSHCEATIFDASGGFPSGAATALQGNQKSPPGAPPEDTVIGVSACSCRF